MRAGGPHLLPVDDEVVALVHRTGPQTGEIAAGVGLGITLAPQLVGAEDTRQVALLLFLGAPMDKGRAQQVQCAGCRQDRGASAEIFFVENHLLHKTGAAAAILGGPGNSDPARGVHRLLPGDALFERLTVRRDALVGGIVDADLRRQMGLEPMTEFNPKFCVLRAVGEIH
jgi:hypothetical protein